MKMNFNSKVVLSAFFIFILITGLKKAEAQIFPDYKERSFSEMSDSLALTNFPAIATEGSVDPEEYILGPGDKLFLSIGGLEDISLTLFVNQEGILFIPKVGAVDLRNTTLEAGKKKIKDAIDRYYKNVDVFISLVDFRRIKVSLLGDVKVPSTYTLTGNSRLMDLIANSRGLTKTSNYRNIKVVDKDGKVNNYDFLSFLRFGDKEDNPLLQEGSSVIVDKVDKIVSLSGEVKFPGVYEFVPKETAYHLIKLAGGLLSKAKLDTIEIVSFNNDGKSQISRYYSFTNLKDRDVILHNQDQVIIRKKPEYYVDRYVKVEGYVKYPGYYKIIEDKTKLSEIINEAGGFRKEASLTEATLTRYMGTVDYDPEYERLKLMQRADMTDDEYDYFKAKSRQRKGRVVVDFPELFKKHNESEDIILRRGDIISVPEAKNYIVMLGQVVNPGNVIYNKNYTIDDYIKLAGGFGWRAKEGEVRVIRSNTGEWVYADDADSLNPGDAIWVPEDPPGPKFWDVFTTSLQVVGQIASIVAAMIAVIVATRK